MDGGREGGIWVHLNRWEVHLPSLGALGEGTQLFFRQKIPHSTVNMLVKETLSYNSWVKAFLGFGDPPLGGRVKGDES